MTRHFWLPTLLAVALATPAAAQVRLTLTPAPASGLSDSHVYAGQFAPLSLTVRNVGPDRVTVSGLRGERVACPTFKVYDRAGGPPRRSPATDCLVGKVVGFTGGQTGVYNVQLPIALQPGEYTVILTVPTSRGTQYPRTTLRVGPGPFVAELRVPPRVKAGTPLPLDVVHRNVWRTSVTQDLRLCGAGLLLRDGAGRVVYDSRPEEQACTTDLRPTTVRPGAAHVQRWDAGAFPRLAPGSYTAVLWGRYNASTRFEVTK